MHIITVACAFLMAWNPAGWGDVSVGPSPLEGHRVVAEDSMQVRGQVVDSEQDGAPVVGAVVELRELERQVRTDARGRFSFEDVPPGRWTVRARAPGLAPRSVELHVTREAAGRMELRVVLDVPLFELGEVVATVSPLGSQVGYQPARALDRDALTRRMDTSVGVMLDGQPGVDMRSMGPAPARPVIRGFDGDRLLVLEDGERMGDLSETAADHAISLDPMAVERAEVVRGPASLLYGPSALGGVVNLHTRDLPRTWSAGWSGSVVSHGATVNRSGSALADVVYGGAGWAVTGRASVREAGDIRTPEARLPGTSVSGLDAQLGAVGRWRGVETGASFSAQGRSYGIPEAIDDPDEDVRITTERQAVQGRLEWTPNRAGWMEGLEVRYRAVRFFQQELERDLVDLQEDVELEFLQHALFGTAIARHRALGPLDPGAVGASLRSRKVRVGGDEAFTPGAREVSLGLFAFQELPVSPSLRLQFGARVEGERGRTLPNAAFPEAEEDRSTWAASGSVGFNWQPGEGWEVGAQLARAHRNPTVEELFADGPHLAAGVYELGDAELGDEVGHGADLFLRHSWERASVEVAAFGNWIRDFVAFQPLGEEDPASGLPIFRYEPTDARMLGGEVTVAGRVGSALHLAGGVDYVRGDRIEGMGLPSNAVPDADSDPGRQRAGNTRIPLPSMPPLRGRMELRYEPGRWWVGSTVRAVRSQRRVAPGESPTGGYLLLDADVGARLDGEGHHTVVLRVDNATNRLYRDHLSRVEERGFPMPARNLALVYRFRY